MKTVAIIYGGRSAEHDISKVSGKSVADNLDKGKFEVREVFIDKKGNWFVSNQKTSVEEALVDIDVVFPVLHGTFGEDGKIQGLFEMLNLPYVGCGVEESVMGMDKEFSKIVWQKYGLPVVEFTAFSRSVWNSEKEKILGEVNSLELPLFVKPANLGSSVGISKVKSLEELEKSIEAAFSFGEKIVVEEAVKNPREIEVSVLGNDEIEISVPGEIIPDREFYDYASKYDAKSTTKLLIPAPITEELADEIKQTAKEAFVELGLSGLARVDFLLEDGSIKFYVNEVNTMPGFTPISMYPKLWEASGLRYPELLTKLIALAEEKFATKGKFKVT